MCAAIPVTQLPDQAQGQKARIGAPGTAGQAAPHVHTKRAWKAPATLPQSCISASVSPKKCRNMETTTRAARNSPAPGLESKRAPSLRCELARVCGSDLHRRRLGTPARRASGVFSLPTPAAPAGGIPPSASPRAPPASQGAQSGPSIARPAHGSHGDIQADPRWARRAEHSAARAAPKIARACELPAPSSRVGACRAGGRAEMGRCCGPQEESPIRGPNICLQISAGWGSGGWGQTLSRGAQRQDKGQRAQTEAQEVPSEPEEELLPSEGAGALVQAAQGGCGVSFSGDIPAPPGRGAVQPAEGDPAWAGGWAG